MRFIFQDIAWIVIPEVVVFLFIWVISVEAGFGSTWSKLVKASIVRMMSHPALLCVVYHPPLSDICVLFVLLACWN